MRILLVILNYHPAANPNVYRWSAIAEHWVENGHEVHVLCTRRSGMPDSDTIRGVQVHRSGPATLLDWAYNFLGKEMRRGEAGGLPVGREGWFRRVTEKIADWTWRRVYWPDGSCLWYWSGLSSAKKLLRACRFDALCSVGLPFTAHWIAFSLKKMQPESRWLMDIEDPFCFSDAFFVNNAGLYRRLNHWAEHKAFRKADSIVLTVQQARERYLQLFPWAAEKTRIIPPLFNLPFPSGLPVEAEQYRKVRLAYFGSFYTRTRTPDFFLRLLEQMLDIDPTLPNRLSIHFYGELTGPFAGAFQENPRLLSMFHFHGLVPREAVARAMEESDFLLNIGNFTNYHLPSKSADYLMSGKPIISLSFVQDDPFTQFFQGYPCFLELKVSGPPARRVLAEKFLAFLAENKGRVVRPELLNQLGSAYQLEPIARAYLEALTSS